MTRRSWTVPVSATLIVLFLALPAVRAGLEADMSWHMLVQLPVLAVCGGCWGRAVPEHIKAVLAPWNRQGISGLLLASLTGLFWMLPRALDLALEQPGIELAKFLSLPLLVGLPVALSWPVAGFVVRGLVLMETIAMLFRIGWLYLVAPVQVCANYRVDAQQVLGRAMLGIGFALLAVLIWRVVWGRVRVDSGAG